MPIMKCNHNKYNNKFASTGNVISDQQYSQYIRPWDSVHIIGYKNGEAVYSKLGEGTNFDLKNLPWYVSHHIKSKALEYAKKGQQTIIYCVRHYNQPGKTVVLGHILTKGHKDGYERLFSIPEWNITGKQRDVFDTFKSLISKD